MQETEKKQEEKQEEKRERHARREGLLYLLAAVLSVLCILEIGMALQEPETPAQPRMVQVWGSGETETEKQSGTETDPEPEGTEALLQETEPVRMELTDWQAHLFGTQGMALAGSIQVSGLTKAERRQTGFRESDFVRQASAFFLSQDLYVTQIRFQKQVACSGEGIAYQAISTGSADRNLYVLMYPDYPGKYIFLLSPEEKNAPETDTVQSEQPLTASDRREAEAENADTDYDVNRLSVRQIPDTLANYLANPYELQYSLYDYLYQHKKSAVTEAILQDYKILPEMRQARIRLKLSDGSSIEAVYDKEKNQYSYDG